MKNVRVVLKNPTNKNETIDYTITAHDTELARDWLTALEHDIVRPNLNLEKNFCFLGFPYTHRTIEYLCNELNQHCREINLFNGTGIWQAAGLQPYTIEEWFSDETVRYNNSYPIAPPLGEQSHDDDPRYLGLKIKHNIMNVLHNHFERLQGTIWNPSRYYALASPRVKHAIRNLNLLCHELESLILSKRKIIQAPDWVRPSQITTFVNVPRRELTAGHRDSFKNGYDKRFGEVYMHWTQIGKTLMEVYNDEGAPDLVVGNDPTDISVGAGTTCEAINALKFYSGEFDIEWGKSVTYSEHSWHREHINGFYHWLEHNGVDHTNPKLSLGYLPIASVDMQDSFGTTNEQEVWKILGNYLDIYQIEINGITATYDYSWSDADYQERQIALLR